MMRLKIFGLSCIFLLTLSACEEVIDLDLEEGESQLVVDAFISNEAKVQVVKLTKTAAYFNNDLPVGVSGALVSLSGSDGSSYTFVEQQKGSYEYDASSTAINNTGTSYTLEISFNGKNYRSSSVLEPVPTVDTIVFFEEENPFTGETGVFAEFFANDIPGRTDYYWIKSYKNQLSTDDLGDFNLAKDASFIGDAADGFVFILPIRRSINNFDEAFQIGDTSKVYLNALNKDAWDYLVRINTESNNGGLFSVPPANIKSNIMDEAGLEQQEVLGLFCMMSVEKAVAVYKGN